MLAYKAAIYLTKETTLPPPIPTSKLSLKHCTRLLWFEHRNLHITNSLFALSSVITAISCLATSDSLQDFIHTSTEYSSVRLNGADLMGRFRRSIRNLTLLLVVCLFSFLLRSIMLILRLILHGQDIFFLSLFGLLWFLFADIFPNDSCDFEEVEVFPYFDSSGEDFNRPSQVSVGAENDDEGDNDGLGKPSFWSAPNLWLFSPTKRFSRLTTNFGRESMSSEPRLSEVSCRSTETVSVLTSFASIKTLLSEHSGSTRSNVWHNNDSSSSINSSSLLNGTVVTNEYPVNGNHFSPGKLNATVSSSNMLAGILLGSIIPSLHSAVTSDIPGNPHAFDDCIISLFRTLPEPSNFNIVWTSLPLSMPLIIRGSVPPSRVNSISLYGKGSSEPPSSLDIELISKDSKFEVKVLPDSIVSDGNDILSSRKWKRGFCAMRNYNVPPGTVIRTPEIVSLSDGAVIRSSQVIVAGPASTASSYKRRTMRTGIQLALFHLVIASIAFDVYGGGQSSSNAWLTVFITVSLLGLSISVLLYHACFLLGKAGLRKFSRDICPAANEFYLVSLEHGAKGSQPSLLHTYYLMKYRIGDSRDGDGDGDTGDDLVVKVKIDPSLQKYWSLVLYDGVRKKGTLSSDSFTRLRNLHEFLVFESKVRMNRKTWPAKTCDGESNAVEEELDYLVNKRDNSNTTIFANSNVEVAELSSRYKQKISAIMDQGIMNTEEAIKITDFFTAEFISYYLEYKYVMKELHTEIYETVSVGVQLPLISPPLNDFVQL
eukprot:gene24316-32753_t